MVFYWKYIKNEDWATKLAHIGIWISGIIFTLWCIAKIFNLINTPIWIKIIPYCTAIIALVSVILGSGKFLQKFEYLIEDVKDLKKTVAIHTTKFTKIETEIKHIKEDIVHIKAKVF